MAAELGPGAQSPSDPTSLPACDIGHSPRAPRSPWEWLLPAGQKERHTGPERTPWGPSQQCGVGGGLGAGTGAQHQSQAALPSSPWWLWTSPSSQGLSFLICAKRMPGAWGLGLRVRCLSAALPALLPPHPWPSWHPGSVSRPSTAQARCRAAGTEGRRAALCLAALPRPPWLWLLGRSCLSEPSDTQMPRPLCPLSAGEGPGLGRKEGALPCWPGLCHPCPEYRESCRPE